MSNDERVVMSDFPLLCVVVLFLFIIECHLTRCEIYNRVFLFMRKTGLISGVLLLFWGTVVAQVPDFKNPEKDVETRVNDLVSRMTLEEKVDLLAGYEDFYLHPCERLGVPAFRMADGPLGIASWGLWGRATAFPSALSLSASWNRELAAQVGGMYAREWRARGIHFMLAPGVNIYRASKGARNFEYFGEDPFLTSEMVVPFIRGVQGGGVIATVKHFAANDQEFDRYSVSSEVSERTLREIYLPAFHAAVQKAGIWAVMTGYNPVNGVYNTQNKHLIDILKKEWGFKGMLMSDWACTYSAYDAAVNGLDLEMGSKSCFNRKELLPLIKSGKVSEEVINDKVRRVYRACFAMGFFDREQQTEDPLFNPDANKMALTAAQEGIILLKNDRQFLPLDASKVKTIAVIGPTANPTFISDRVFGNNRIVYGGGGSSKVNPWYVVSDLEGIQNHFGECRVLYDEGISNNFKSRTFSSSEFITADGKRGLKASYYGKENTQPVKTQIDRQVNFEWWGGVQQMGLGEEFAVCWEGFILPQYTEKLTLLADAQGGFRVWVEDQLVMDAGTSVSFCNRTYTLPVKKGEKIKVKLEYNSHNSSPAEIRFGYVYNHQVDFRESLKIAGQADAVIVCAGLDGAIELEGRDRPFELPFGQDSLINAILKVNPNVCVVVHAGGGVDMTHWVDRVPAVLHALYAGQEGGNALGGILCGDVVPSAKLPFTIEKRWEDSPACGNYDETRDQKKVFYNEGIFTGYRGYDRKGIQPLFPFGYGLSYTDFEYSDLKVTELGRRQVEVSFVLKNIGQYAGAEVAQVYVRDVKSVEERPQKELKGFEKIVLAPGESKLVRIVLDEEAFRYFNAAKNRWVFEKGEFDILVGPSSGKLVLNRRISLKR